MKKHISRRHFTKNSALALGAVTASNIKGIGNVFAASSGRGTDVHRHGV